MKRTMALLLVVLVSGFVSSVYASKTGDTMILEGLAGGKYSGAPSQALAGRLGLTFEHLRDAINEMMIGKVNEPAKLKELGFDLVKDDQVELKRIDEFKWELKLVKQDMVVPILVK